MSCYRKTGSKADRLLAAMSSMRSWSWASAFRSRAGIEASRFAHWDPIVVSFILRELSARVLGKSGHSEATAVVALELLGRDKGKMVEDVAKHVQKLHAMQAIMK